MVIELDRLATAIDGALSAPEPVPGMGGSVYQMLGLRAEVIYLDVGLGRGEILSVLPKNDSLPSVLIAIMAVGELEGGG